VLSVFNLLICDVHSASTASKCFSYSSMSPFAKILSVKQIMFYFGLSCLHICNVKTFKKEFLKRLHTLNKKRCLTCLSPRKIKNTTLTAVVISMLVYIKKVK